MTRTFNIFTTIWSKRYEIQNTSIIAIAILVGWYLNDGFRYATEIKRQADLCIELNCDSLKHNVEIIEKGKLPVLIP